MFFGGVGKVRGGKTVDGFFVVATRVGRIAATLRIAPEPVEGVDGAAGNGIFAQEDAELFAGVGLAKSSASSVQRLWGYLAAEVSMEVSISISFLSER